MELEGLMIMSEIYRPHLVLCDPEAQATPAIYFVCCSEELPPRGFVAFVFAVARVGSGEVAAGSIVPRPAFDPQYQIRTTSESRPAILVMVNAFLWLGECEPFPFVD